MSGRIQRRGDFVTLVLPPVILTPGEKRAFLDIMGRPLGIADIVIWGQVPSPLYVYI